MVSLALSVSGLRKSYGSVQALRGVDLEIGTGELFGLLGPNGAGKSTLVKIACGLVHPTAGAVDVCGSPAGSAEAHGAIGYLAELFRFPDWCTADELLELHQELTGSPGGEAERRELLELVELGDVPDRRVGAMSKGMQQRLGLAQALIGEPRLLLLDEPSLGLAPLIVEYIFQVIAKFREHDISVLLIEQNAMLALEFAGWAYALSHGQITFSHAAQELRDTDLVRRAYLA
jgi:ABC-2 type transport system ATP-binding protein